MARHEKQNKARGTGLKPEERTEAQQQKCVTASATVGALLRYIRRCDEKNAKRNEKFGYGQTGPRTKQQQEACVAASATVGAFLRYICRRDLKYKADADKYGWGLDEKDLNDQQRQACVSASSTVDAC